MASFMQQKNKTASHDPVNPPKLLSYMLANWKPASGKMPKPIKNNANFARRRAALSKIFPGELLIIPTGNMKVRSNDTFYSFRPCSDFYYFTGNVEPDCVLLMRPTEGGHEPILFVEPNPGKSDATFYTDRVKGELWEGPRLGLKESAALFGMATKSIADANEFVKKEIANAKKGFRLLRNVSMELDAICTLQAERDQAFATQLSEMRLFKDKEEIAELSAAIAATKKGFEDVIRRIKSAKNERELEGVFFTRARMEGNDVGYGTIVASGSHACTLHWKKNDGALRKGELLLLDAGVEGNSLYTADITRTLPINGKFSPAQKEIYSLVLASQKAALKEVKPGNEFLAPYHTAMKVIAEGLEELGIIPSAAEALDPENQFHKRYTLHGVSHMLGLDVHDCAQARNEFYRYGKFQAGMVLTVEPGLYFQVDDLTVPAKYRGIGVRIEDDVLVTEKGCKNLSASIPKEVKDVEAWMKLK